MTDATNASTVTIASHKDGINVAYIFNAVDQSLALAWNGSYWFEI